MAETISQGHILLPSSRIEWINDMLAINFGSMFAIIWNIWILIIGNIFRWDNSSQMEYTDDIDMFDESGCGCDTVVFNYY